MTICSLTAGAPRKSILPLSHFLSSSSRSPSPSIPSGAPPALSAPAPPTLARRRDTRGGDSPFPSLLPPSDQRRRGSDGRRRLPASSTGGEKVEENTARNTSSAAESATRRPAGTPPAVASTRRVPAGNLRFIHIVPAPMLRRGPWPAFFSGAGEAARSSSLSCQGTTAHRGYRCARYSPPHALGA